MIRGARGRPAKVAGALAGALLRCNRRGRAASEMISLANLIWERAMTKTAAERFREGLDIAKSAMAVARARTEAPYAGAGAPYAPPALAPPPYAGAGGAP